jgi:acid phosphatase class B
MRNDDGSVFYVGKGTGDRAWRKHGRNKWWNAVVKKHGYTVHLCSIWETSKEAGDHEVFLIDMHKRNGDPLVNVTDGGDERSWKKGYHTKEHSEKIALSRLKYFAKQREETGKAQTISADHSKKLRAGFEKHFDSAKTKSGVRGVKLHRGRWEVRVKLNNKEIYCGSYLTKEQAASVAIQKRSELHKMGVV